MSTQKDALDKIGQFEILKTHDDGDLTVKDAAGCIHVVTTEGETFNEESCECLTAMAKGATTCPVTTPTASPVNAEVYDYLRDWVRKEASQRDWSKSSANFQQESVHAFYEREIKPHLSNVVGARIKANKATTFVELEQAITDAQDEFGKRLHKVVEERAERGKVSSTPSTAAASKTIAAHGLKPVSQQSKEILDIVTAGVLASDETSKKWDSKRGFMPLAVEYVGPSKLGAIYSLAHYYEQQGDLMRDPEMEFIKGSDGNYYPISFWQDNPPVREEVVEWDDKSGNVIGVNRRQQASEAQFANTWLRNIKQQQNIGEGGGHVHDIQSPDPGGSGSASAGVHKGVLPTRVQADEEEGRTKGALSPQSQCDTEVCRDIDTERRREPGAGLEHGHSQRDPGEGERLEPPAIVPRDVVLTPTTDIGAGAGAAARFDANLEALRIIKLIETGKRHATPDEQAILVKYSGFGDSAFNGAFETRGYKQQDDIWKRRGDQLRALTTPEEFQAIERSRLNAFYTSPEIVNATWQALQQMGANSLSHPRILEPSAGSGRFFGFQPIELASRSKRIAVELDQLTGRMLKETYPNAEVYVMGYEQAPIARDSIDIAISNVPFGDYPITDPSFTKERRRLTRQIHNYFFAKTLDQLRPGGMLAFITSHSTLDAPTAKPVREALAEQADLIGAIRLPQGAFPDTDVVTDIVFMRKRQPGETPGDSSWVNYGEVKLCELEKETCDYPVRVNVNQYFIDHPEMILGKQVASGSMYRGGEYTVAPFPGRPLSVGLAESIKRMPANILSDVPTLAQQCSVPIEPGLLASREGSFVLGDDGATVFVQRRGRLVKADMRVADMQRVREMLAIRDAARAALNIQLCDGALELPKKLERLNEVYDAFVIKNGPLNSTRNSDLMRNDPDGPFLRALENWDIDKKDRKTATAMKAATSVPEDQVAALKTVIFSKRVVHGMGEREEHTMTTDVDAMSVVLNESGHLDFKRMAALLGKTEEEVLTSLAAKRLIYKNPLGDWEQAERYLSGDVRDKLRTAEACATANPKLCAANVEALRAVQPPRLPPSQISVRLGVPWIPNEDVDVFVGELLEIPSYRKRRGEPIFKYIGATGEWKRTVRVSSGLAESEKWGTSRISADEIILRLLNGKPIEVMDKVDDKSVRNEKETIAAQDKATAIQNAFKDWVWKDPERSLRLADIYNNTFNSTRPRIFNGQHQEFPGMASSWYRKFHPHQKDAVWRVVQDRTALLGHEVGFGKTAVMAAGGMELRRLGLSRKNLYVVPKATHGQFYKDFRDIYPFANILFPTDDDFTPARRTEFISRAVTGDWDAIIISESQFRRIPIKPETELKFLRDEVEALRMSLEAEEESGGQRSSSHKEIQKALIRAEERVKETQAQIGAITEHTMYFEDMGIDELFVDEADMYKNLQFATRMGRVKGLPNSKSQRAWDMFQKCRYLQERGSGQGVVFATGTPVANTIAEMYTMMRYLQSPLLESIGLQRFDDWAKTFGETTDALEQTVTGKYRMTQRFAKFVNMPELSSLWQQAADIRVASEVPDIVKRRPRIVDEQGRERRTVIAAPPDEPLLDYIEGLGKRASELSGVDPRDDNMLKIASDARKASLDMRMVDPNAPPNLNGKIALASQKIAEIYQETMKDKGTQLVFLDIGTPKAKEDAKGDEEPQDGEALDETAEEEQVLRNVYKVVKDTLLRAGLPENEVAFIHDAKTTTQRDRIQDKVNSGEIRVIIGSTGKLGTGLNMQYRAAALHHLDCPWRPRDIEQREGRVIRQGNKIYGPKLDPDGKVTDPGPGVRIYAYVTERSFDSYMWQSVESKSRPIKSIMRRENPPRVIDDIDSFTMSAGEAKAIASGNPDVLKTLTIKNEVNRLQMLRASDLDTKVRAREQVQALPGQIEQLQIEIAKEEQDAKLAQDPGVFKIIISGRAFSERPPAGEALADAVQHSYIADNPKDAIEIGQYKGFTMRALSLGGIAPGWKIFLQNPNTGLVYATTTIQEMTPAGVMQRVDNVVANIPATLEQTKHDLSRSLANLKTYTAEMSKPFAYADRLAAKEAELAIVEKKLRGEEVTGEQAVMETAGIEEELPELPVEARKEIIVEPAKRKFVEPYEPPMSGAEVIEQVTRGAAATEKAMRPMTAWSFDKDEHGPLVTEFKTDKGEFITLVRAGPQKGKWKFTVAGVPRIADSATEAYDAIQELTAPKAVEHKEVWEQTLLEFYDSRQNTPFELSSAEAKTIHRGEVAQAIISGKPVPAAVLAEYPQLVKGLPKQKELWEMTMAEFAASQNKPISNIYVQQQRDAVVKQAIAAGKPVPAAILAEYTTLTKEPWLMTRDEYRASENKPKLEAIQAAIKAGKPIILRTALKGTKLTKPEHLQISVSGYMQIPSGNKWLYLTDSQVDQLADQAGVAPTPFEERKYHKAIVEEALSEGKSVPAMVLADYPDLRFPLAEAKEKEPAEAKPRFGYVGFYKGKRFETYANTTFEAQKKMAQEHRIKNAYDISVMLAEVDGKTVIHRPEDIEEALPAAEVQPTPIVAKPVPAPFPTPEEIRMAIVNALPKSGEYLHVNQIAEAVGVSQDHIRKYVKQLEELGQIQYSGAGTWSRKIASSKAVLPPISEGKLPWELKAQAYSDYEAKVMGESYKPITEQFIAWHKGKVKEALSEHKPVPAEVVAEYPELFCGSVFELVGTETKGFGSDPSNPHRYEFRYKVLDLKDVVASHLDNFEPNPRYPKELQPRIRDRAASKVQIGGMAANLNPQMLLHDSGFLDTGPMIVGADNVVESGNGRTLALRLAAREHPDKYQQYVDMLKATAADYGLSETDITQVCQPVLVRERLTDGTRESFTAEANVGAVMRMSPYEQALQDSGRLSDFNIGTLEIGEEQSIDQALRAKANNHIVQHFVSTLPANERAAISESGGAINQQGLDRLKLAIFAKTYPGKAGQRLVRIFGENVDPIIKGLENSMFQTLPDMAKAESLIGTGQRDKNLTIADDLAETVDTLAMLKQRGLKAKDYLKQKEMFEEKLTPNQKIMLEHLDDISHKPRLVRELLRDTAQRIVESPPPGQVSLLGFAPLTKEDLVNTVIQKQRKEQGLAPVTELTLAPHTSVQVGLEGMGKETAQVRMLEEFGAGASEKKQPLVDVEAMKARAAAKPLPGQITLGAKEPWEGKAYRAETGYRHEAGQTAADVARYEQEDLGNDLGITGETISELEKYPATDLVWVAKTKKGTTRYGGGVEYQLPPGSVIVATDDEGGYLVLKGKPTRIVEQPLPRVTREPWETRRADWTGLPERHREFVRQAIREGKRIPAEVLEDYPMMVPPPAPTYRVRKVARPEPQRRQVLVPVRTPTPVQAAMDLTCETEMREFRVVKKPKWVVVAVPRKLQAEQELECTLYV